MWKTSTWIDGLVLPAEIFFVEQQARLLAMYAFIASCRLLHTESPGVATSIYRIPEARNILAGRVNY